MENMSLRVAVTELRGNPMTTCKEEMFIVLFDLNGIAFPPKAIQNDENKQFDI